MQAAPLVFVDDTFALKGGTVIGIEPFEHLPGKKRW